MGFVLKKLAIFPTIILLILISLGAAPANKVTLHTVDDASGKPINQARAIMDNALQEMDKSGRYQDIVFFIHGRGKHPAKGMKIMPKFAQKYDLRVIMFHGPSWTGVTNRPVSHAQAAALQLKQLLNQLVTFKEQRQAWLDEHQIRFTLFLHSMGNIVMQEYLLTHHLAGALPSNLIDNVIFNAADVPVKNHQIWMENIDFTERTYVTINRSDIILAGSKAIDLIHGKFSGRRLGHAKSKKLTPDNITRNVSYVDLSQVSGNQHRYYLKSKDSDVNYFFATIFHGKEAQLTPEQGVYPISRKKVNGRSIASTPESKKQKSTKPVQDIYEFRR